MKLEHYLTEKGIELADFAADLNKPITTVWRYLKGERIPSKVIMPEIVSLTGGQVTANDFYDIVLPEVARVTKKQQVPKAKQPARQDKKSQAPKKIRNP